jgi:hypothetical protein
MAVKLLRLKSGEDIVTDVKKENIEYTTVNVPAMLVPMGGQGQQMKMFGSGIVVPKVSPKTLLNE